MLKAFRVLIISILTLLLVNTVRSQDVGFSQFYANQLYLNPAMAGTTKCPKLGFSYRNHYPTLPNVFTTYSASYDQFFKGIHGGVGVLLMRDQQAEGKINTTNFAAMYSFTFKLTRKFFIKAGFQAGFFHRNINTDGMIFPDMIDETTGNIIPSGENLNSESKSHIDFAAGIAGYGKRLYFGAAVHHLNPWEEAEAGENYFVMDRKYTVHFGYEFPIGGGIDGSKTSFSPNIIAQMQQDFQQINYGAYLQWKVLVFGAWFKQNFGMDVNTASLLVGFYHRAFRFGYSFDYPINELRKDFFAAHEVSLAIFLPCLEKKKKYEAISCPKF